ncbi:MAG: YerC/YecD family TrpR-related protein [Eubacteriales bacterium]
MTEKDTHHPMDELYEEVLKIRTLAECQAFFSDLCTYKELESMLQRIRAAKMLLEGKTYQQVIAETDISSATLSRVSRCIKHGPGGYPTILSRPSAPCGEQPT